MAETSPRRAQRTSGDNAQNGRVKSRSMSNMTRDIAKPGPLMAGKRGLVMGVANDRSIAWGIARVLAGQGAELAFTYQGGAFGRRAVPLAKSLGSEIIEPCRRRAISTASNACSTRSSKKWGALDFVVHALAFSDRSELRGRYADTTRENFTNTMVISCFSFTEIAKRAAELMPNGGSLLTLTYGGATRVGAVLQRHGRRQGGARSLRALSRGRLRPAGHPRQRALGRADAHAGRRRRLRCARDLQLPAATLAAAPHADAGRGRRLRALSAVAICRARSPARCISSTAATRPSPCRTLEALKTLEQAEEAESAAEKAPREAAQ